MWPWQHCPVHVLLKQDVGALPFAVALLTGEAPRRQNSRMAFVP